MTVTLADVEAARRTLRAWSCAPRCCPAPKLSEITGAEVFVKYENLQVTNPFKERGAYVKLTSLTEAQRNSGVIAMSAGNHAQAVAYHSRRLGIPSTIVMPSPPVREGQGDRGLWRQGGAPRRDALRVPGPRRRARRRPSLVLVHPYDDPAIIAGQGTVALEVR